MSEFKAIISAEGDPLLLSPPLMEGHKREANYRPAPGLKAAIDVALMLGEPILLTGDPGVGKTRAAYWLAQALGVQPLLICNVKSTSTGVDLLYAFDEVARFRDSSRQQERPLVKYLRFNGLGEAILRGAGGRAVLQNLAGEPLEGEVALKAHAEMLEQAFGDGWKPIDGAVRASMLLPDDAQFAAAPAGHRVLLIDELDKAPRDTPNDLLSEVENMSFRIPELGLQVVSEGGLRPIIVVTSNSEKALPDPFLRRCVYFDIPFPKDAQLLEIVEGSIDSLEGGAPIVDDAIALFQRFREPASGVRKSPGTAELLAWLDILVNRYKLEPTTNLAAASVRDSVVASLTAVLKTKDDLNLGPKLVSAWADTPGKPGR